MKKLILVAALLFPILFGAFAHAGQAKESNSVQPENHRITESKAKQIALKKVKGEFLSIKLENDDGREHYEVKIKQSGTIYEVEIDAKTGKIIEVEKEGQHDDDGRHHDDDGHHDDDDGHHDDDGRYDD